LKQIGEERIYGGLMIVTVLLYLLHRFQLLDFKGSYENQEIIGLFRREYPAVSPDDIRFGSRAVCSGYFYHSKLHNRNNADIVKFECDSEAYGSHQCGEIQVFAAVGLNLYAVIKRLQIRFLSNIATVPPPSNKLLREHYDERQYGTFFQVMCETAQLAIVDVMNIVCNCVIIMKEDYCIVTDVMPYEHD